MVWQESFSPTGGPSFDSERERERRLASQARAGADWALTALVARYQPTVVRYLTRLTGNQEHASSMAEHIFQRMERRLHGPQGADNLRLWLLRASTEAGLDALRKPNSAPIPRLAGAAVAGLLGQETTAGASGFIQQSLRRLRKANHSTDRQARPLVWNDPEPTYSATPEAHSAHVDEELDRLDPREALRHRLVRVTLAELPYGDAQCLALHLVAGLNQAEVAKALGITNSAARKRMVHGLALFSDRYTTAVQSLGLPAELGYGEAVARTPVAEADLIAPLPPEPVIVPSEASDVFENEQPVTSAEEILRQAVNEDTYAYGMNALSGVSYLAEDTNEMAALSLDDDDDDEPADLFMEPFTDADPAEMPYATPGDEMAQDEVIDGADPAHNGVGQITRLASDSIIGPVVDALPVSSGSSSAWPMPPEVFRHTGSPGFGQPSSHSIPLDFELSSNDELQAATTGSLWRAGDAEDTEDDVETQLSYETVAAGPSSATMPPAFDDDAPITFEADPDSFSRLTPLMSEQAAPWEYERPAFAKPEVAATPPVRVPILSAPIVDRIEDPELSPTNVPETYTSRPRQSLSSRSLEDIWDELATDDDF